MGPVGEEANATAKRKILICIGLRQSVQGRLAALRSGASEFFAKFVGESEANGWKWLPARLLRFGVSFRYTCIETIHFPNRGLAPNLPRNR
jgi:hypothetical protein